jgi:glycosyltransferase involved in cell wall biosynthesis
MKMKHKISIITPVLNDEKYIRTAIESVLNQNYPHVEHIVIDGLSTDKTADILKEYKHLTWISEKDNSGAEAINKGLDMATGDIICLLPADDYYEPNIFKDIIDTFRKYPDCKWISGYGKIVNDEGNQIRKYVKWYKNFLLRHHSFKLLLMECYIVGMGCFFKTELLDEFGYIDLQANTEYDLWLHFASKYGLKIIKKELVNFRMHKGTCTSTLFGSQAKISIEVAKRHSKNFPFLMFLRTINTYKTIFLYSLLNRSL